MKAGATFTHLDISVSPLGTWSILGVSEKDVHDLTMAMQNLESLIWTDDMADSKIAEWDR